jgi:hypothetical protein
MVVGQAVEDIHDVVPVQRRAVDHNAPQVTAAHVRLLAAAQDDDLVVQAQVSGVEVRCFVTQL